MLPILVLLLLFASILPACSRSEPLAEPALQEPSPSGDAVRDALATLPKRWVHVRGTGQDASRYRPCNADPVEIELLLDEPPRMRWAIDGGEEMLPIRLVYPPERDVFPAAYTFIVGKPGNTSQIRLSEYNWPPARIVERDGQEFHYFLPFEQASALPEVRAPECPAP